MRNVNDCGSTGAAICADRLSTNSRDEENSLNELVNHIESSLRHGGWNTEDFSWADRKWMPQLVQALNERKAGLNVTYLERPAHFETELCDFVKHGLQSKQYIVSLDKGIHFVVLDVRLVAGTVSVLLFEPATLNAFGPALLALQLGRVINRSGVANVKLCRVELDVQRSDAECGIFSLALTRKIFKASDAMESLHRKNIDREISNGVGSDKIVLDKVGSDEIDSELPAEFFKHVQGQRRLEKYLESNAEAKHVVVNKKGESLTQRLTRNLEQVGNGVRSNSIHKKRLSEYQLLRKHLEDKASAALRSRQLSEGYGVGFNRIDSVGSARNALVALVELASADGTVAATLVKTRDETGNHLGSRLAELVQSGGSSLLAEAYISVLRLLYKDGKLAKQDVIANLLPRKDHDEVKCLAQAIAGANWGSNEVREFCSLLLGISLGDDRTRAEIVGRCSMTQAAYLFKNARLRKEADFFNLAKHADRLGGNPDAIALLREGNLIPERRQLYHRPSGARSSTQAGELSYPLLLEKLTDSSERRA